MAAYPTIRNALSMYSVDLGLDEQEANAMFDRSFSNVEWARALCEELGQAIEDRELSWSELVANDEYEIDEPESEQDAKEIVLKILWARCFPDRGT